MFIKAEGDAFLWRWDKLKVLNLTEIDFGGCAYRLTETLVESGRHESKHITRLPPGEILGYGCGLVTDKREVIEKWLEWADVVNCWESLKPLRRGLWPKPGSRLFFIAVGSWYWKDHEKIHKRADENGFTVLSGLPDLMEWGAKWFPIAVPVERWRKLKRKREAGKPIVCQSPINPAGAKNTSKIEAVLAGKTNIDFKVITGISHEQCMREKAVADIYIDQFRTEGGKRGGYGLSSLEAMAMRIPVITIAPDSIERIYINEIGYLPYFRSEIEDLPEAIDGLLSNRALYDEYVDKGHEYVLKFHDYPSVVKRFEELNAHSR